MVKLKTAAVGRRRPTHKRDNASIQAKVKSAAANSEVFAFSDGLDTYCICGDFVSSNEESYRKHIASAAHRRNFISDTERKFTFGVRLGKSAFKNNIAEYHVDLHQSKAQTVSEILEETKETIKSLWEFEKFNNDSMKAQIRINTAHENPIRLCQLPDDEEPEPHNFIDLRELRSAYSICVPAMKIEKFIAEQKPFLEKQLENMVQYGSGWNFESFSNLTLSFAQLDMVRGSSYIPTPPCIAARKATINIKNAGNA